jgi:hypothetical protein
MWPWPEVDVGEDVCNELPSRVWRKNGKAFFILSQYLKVVFTPESIKA